MSVTESSGNDPPGIGRALGPPGSLADSVSDLILVVDAGGRIVSGNRRTADVLGRAPEGLHLGDLLGAEAARSHLARLASTQCMQEFEAPVMVGQGEPVGHLWVAAPVGDGTVALSGRDMTHVYGLDLIRRLTEDLQERQQRLEVVMEINRALAGTLDLERIDALVARELGRVLPLDFLQVSVSAASRELFDMRLLDLGGALLASETDRPWAGSPVDWPYRERRPRIREASDLRDGLLGQHGAASALDMPVVLDDRSLGVLTFASRQDDAYRASDPVVVLPVVGQYAVALANARVVRSLEEANRVKREIIQITSHELNTPLTVIKGMSSILAAGTSGFAPEQLEGLLRSIDVQADRLIKLVADLLLVSQIEVGRIDLYLTTVDLGTLVRDTCATVARSHGARQYRCDPPGGVIVRQDANKIVRCLTHLVSNAFKFSTADTTVEIQVQAGPDGWEVRIFNADEGLTADEITGIFEKFGRLARHQNSHEGIGLGLYTTKRLAQRLGGDVRVDSERGRGTTFTLLVPDLAMAD